MTKCKTPERKNLPKYNRLGAELRKARRSRDLTMGNLRASTAREKEKDSEIEVLRAEIESLKGTIIDCETRDASLNEGYRAMQFQVESAKDILRLAIKDHNDTDPEGGWLVRAEEFVEEDADETVVPEINVEDGATATGTS